MSETDTVVYANFGDGKLEAPPPMPREMDDLEAKGPIVAEFVSWIVGLTTHSDARIRDRAERWQERIAKVVGKPLPPDDNPA